MASNRYMPDKSMPSEDWELNKFLIEISQDIKPEDLEKMKFLCSGEEGFGEKVLQTVDKSLVFFRQLRHRNFLNRFNLLYLQAMVWSLHKPDIHQKFIEFSRKCSLEPLYFFEDDEEKDQGRTAVKFHIGGGDESITHEEIEDLRALVSRLLGIPVEQVLFKGLKPFNSIMVTFSLPDCVVKNLFNMDNVELARLKNKRVNFFTVKEKTIYVKDVESESTIGLSEKDEIRRIIWKNEQLEREIKSFREELVCNKRRLGEDGDSCNMAFQSVNGESATSDEDIAILYKRKRKLERDLEDVNIELLETEKRLNVDQGEEERWRRNQLNNMSENGVIDKFLEVTNGKTVPANHVNKI